MATKYKYKDELLGPQPKELEVAYTQLRNSERLDVKSTTELIANEFVKSYGFKITDDGVSWSVDNVKQAFKDSPGWAAVDWATLLIPPAKWGVAAIQASRGVGLAGKAYKAGDIGMTAAMKVYMESPKA